MLAEVDSHEDTERLLGEHTGVELESNCLQSGARLIIRRGDPSKVSDLLRVNPNKASSIVLLSPERDDDNEADDVTIDPLIEHSTL